MRRKTTTFPQVLAQCSSTQLGQWSKIQDALMAKSSHQELAALSGRLVLSAAGKAATRVGGPVLDAMMGALDPQVFSGGAAILGPDAYRRKLKEKGIELDGDDMLILRGHFARNDWEAVRNVGNAPNLSLTPCKPCSDEV